MASLQKSLLPNKRQRSVLSGLGSLLASAGVDSNYDNLAQSNLAAQNAIENNWGMVGHYSTMATVLYLASFSPKDAKAIALAAWGLDTDKRNAITLPNFNNGSNPSQPQIKDHLLDGEKILQK